MNSQKADNNAKVSMKTYTSNSDRAQENRSSAYVLVGVGIAGLAFMILGYLGIIPFHVGNRYIFYGVMASVFTIFIIMGIVSFYNAKTYSSIAESEVNLMNELDIWVSEKLSKEIVDSYIENAALQSEEDLYFDRVRIINIMMHKDFMNLDENFIEHYIDEVVYEKIFE